MSEFVSCDLFKITAYLFNFKCFYLVLNIRPIYYGDFIHTSILSSDFASDCGEVVQNWDTAKIIVSDIFSGNKRNLTSIVPERYDATFNSWFSLSHFQIKEESR